MESHQPSHDEMDDIGLAGGQSTLEAEIAVVRLKGEIDALVNKIALLRYELEAIHLGRETLDIMSVYLKTLKKLDPSQK